MEETVSGFFSEHSVECGTVVSLLVFITWTRMT